MRTRLKSVLRLMTNDAGATGGGGRFAVLSAASAWLSVPRLTYRYSPFNEMFGDRANSKPPPAVQPVAVRAEFPEKQFGSVGPEQSNPNPPPLTLIAATAGLRIVSTELASTRPKAK